MVWGKETELVLRFLFCFFLQAELATLCFSVATAQRDPGFLAAGLELLLLSLPGLQVVHRSAAAGTLDWFVAVHFLSSPCLFPQSSRVV
jgi:hypothetical protein